jgi:dolichol-phosphate mannosyltransferase
MSGFFMLRREIYDQAAPHLTNQGFKILVDLILSAPKGLRVVEIPAKFSARAAGESKLDGMVMVQFLGLLLQKLSRGLVPLYFVGFCLVGAFGVLVQLAVSFACSRAGLDFAASEVAGTLVAMVANFQLNNTLTYRDRQLRGAALWRGLILFVLVCGLGAFANIGIGRALYADHSGWSLATIAGAAVGAVWNYAVSATLVWRRK